MNSVQKIIETIANTYGNEAISTITLLSMLTVVSCLAVYEYVVYRLISHRSFYNRSFHITIAVLPFFIATIILCLQANIVITLGTIGALAILRFRTAVKDPVDMIYLLWSTHIGIVCGCQLYEVAVLTSLMVTIFLLVFSYARIGGGTCHCLVVRLNTSEEEEPFIDCVKQHTQKYSIKTRNYTGKGIDYVLECKVKKPAELALALEKNEVVENFSLIEYDAEDIV